jgi:CheY-like chemotaxis protein
MTISSPKRLLVVEDDPAIQYALTAYLSRCHYAVQSTANGMEALGRLEQEAFDGVITDLRMPVMDGARLSSRIKARWPEIFVVIATGDTGVDLGHLALESRADAALHKPYPLERLIGVLGACPRLNTSEVREGGRRSPPPPIGMAS